MILVTVDGCISLHLCWADLTRRHWWVSTYARIYYLRVTKWTGYQVGLNLTGRFALRGVELVGT